MSKKKCTICLNHRKCLGSIFDYNGDLMYADMILSIANIKMGKSELVKDLICLNCQKKLRELYDFKILIKSSYLEITALNCRRLQFDNIDEIKCILKPIQEQTTPNSPDLDYSTFIENNENIITYYDTVITKIHNQEPIPDMELLQSINEKSDNEISDCNNLDDSYTETDFEEETHYKKRKRVDPHKTNTKSDSKMTVCIKPIYIKDIIVKAVKTKKRTPKKIRHKPHIVCTHCGKLSKNIDSHMLIHTGVRKFKCNEENCNKKYYTIGHLNMHMKMHLSDAKIYKCDRCPAVFNQQTHLTSHNISRHTNNRPHICEICSKSFKRISSLARHKLVHTIPMVKCEHCGIAFRTKEALRHHLRVHTGERPFNCEICSQPYIYKHDFNRHCLKKHGVFLKRRPIYVMNEEIVQRERALIKDLFFKLNSGLNCNEITNPFEGQQAALAFEMAIKYLKENKIPISDSF